MKIEKRKVSQNKVLSLAAKSAIAAALGMSASLALSACDDSSSAKDDDVEPLGGIVAPDEYRGDPESSSEAASPASSSETAEPETSSETVSPASSSSSSLDIPLSQEPVSSSLMEAISSALESSSSEAAPTSSESVEPESSSSEPTEQEIKDACQGNPGGTPVDIGGHLYLCPDNGGGMLFSMISTFERSDVEA